VTVAVPGRSYDVVIGAGVIEAAAEHLPEFAAAAGQAFSVSDRTVAADWYEPLGGALRERGLSPILLTVPEGEDAKSLEVAQTLYHQLAIRQAHRDDVVIALGGGAIGDLAGFVAATYMRGVEFVQVPTTLTGQVDAAVGGKTAVNLPEGKNLVGAFYQPRCVLCDVDPLASVPERDFRSGLAEVAKYALILDAELLDRLERDLAPVLARDPAVLEDVVARCVRAKAATVATDERDAGVRLLLNYGHTLGHALERLDAFSGRTHGEAIAVGMMFAARLAEATDLARAGLVARHSRLLASLGLEPEGSLPDADAILDAMRMDKKFSAGIRFVLLEDVGRPRIVPDVPEDIVRTTLEALGAGG